MSTCETQQILDLKEELAMVSEILRSELDTIEQPLSAVSLAQHAVMRIRVLKSKLGNVRLENRRLRINILTFCREVNGTIDGVDK